MDNTELFNEIKEIREKKGISLEELSDLSRIQIKYLEALETGDLLQIPEVYDKMFFRAYLRALGENEDLYYERFLEYRKNIRIDKTTTRISFIKAEETPGRFNLIRNLLVIVPLLGVIVVIWFLVQNTLIISSSSENTVKEIDIQNVVKQLESMPAIVQDSTEVDTAEYTELNLNIRGLKSTWFRVVIDNKDTLEYLLPRGNQINLTAANVYEFLIGRADGLQMSLNDKNLERIGADSTVVRYMKIDSTGISAKIFKTDS